MSCLLFLNIGWSSWYEFSFKISIIVLSYLVFLSYWVNMSRASLDAITTNSILSCGIEKLFQNDDIWIAIWSHIIWWKTFISGLPLIFLDNEWISFCKFSFAWFSYERIEFFLVNSSFKFITSSCFCLCQFTSVNLGKYTSTVWGTNYLPNNIAMWWNMSIFPQMIEFYPDGKHCIEHRKFHSMWKSRHNL